MAENKNIEAQKTQAESSAELTKETASKASKDKQGGSKQKKEGFLKRLFSYLLGVRREFGEVVWPTREELTTNTIVVFACVLFFALAFWLVDTGFLAALKGILGITLS